MDVTLILVPYDLGREGVGSGRGPQAYVEAGAARALQSHGHDVEVVSVRRREAFGNELDAVLDVDEGVAEAVADAVRAGRFPLVVAGNCNSALGVRAGLFAATSEEELAGLALVWLDAHGDFNTPETSRTGYLDGMPLAMLTRRAYSSLWSRLGGQPIDESLVLHAGGRDLDPAEDAALSASRIIVVGSQAVRLHGIGGALQPGLDELVLRSRQRGDGRPRLHLHVDIDVLDQAAAPSVAFPTPAGLTVAELLAAIDMAGARFDIRALSLTSFAPGGSGDPATSSAGVAVMLLAASVA